MSSKQDAVSPVVPGFIWRARRSAWEPPLVRRAEAGAGARQIGTPADAARCRVGDQEVVVHAALGDADRRFQALARAAQKRLLGLSAEIHDLAVERDELRDEIRGLRRELDAVVTAAGSLAPHAEWRRLSKLGLLFTSSSLAVWLASGYALMSPALATVGLAGSACILGLSKVMRDDWRSLVRRCAADQPGTQ